MSESTAAPAEHRIIVARSARYYTLGELTPAGSAAEREPELWVACHGYGQLASRFIASFSAIAAPERLIVAPEGLSRFYLDRSPPADGVPPRVGATWMTREDREAEISDHVAYLDAVCARVLAVSDCPRGRVRLRVLGFSQGVATVGRWLAHGATRADELIVWAGSFPPELEPASLRERFARTAVTIVLGTGDEYASWADAEALAARFAGAGIGTRLRSFDGGHRLDDATLAAIASATPGAPGGPATLPNAAGSG